MTTTELRIGGLDEEWRTGVVRVSAPPIALLDTVPAPVLDLGRE
jgi:hypothetical protein